PPPPRSPLFPYTPLFRSVASAISLWTLPSPRPAAAVERTARSALRDIGAGIQVVWRSPVLRLVTIVTALINLGNAMVLAIVLLLDRKSTRLNSSHDQISY